MAETTTERIELLDDDAKQIRAFNGSIAQIQEQILQTQREAEVEIAKLQKSYTDRIAELQQYGEKLERERLELTQGIDITHPIVETVTSPLEAGQILYYYWQGEAYEINRFIDQMIWNTKDNTLNQAKQYAYQFTTEGSPERSMVDQAIAIIEQEYMGSFGG